MINPKEMTLRGNLVSLLAAFLLTMCASVEFYSIFPGDRVIAVSTLGSFVGVAVAYLAMRLKISKQMEAISLIVAFFLLSAPATDAGIMFIIPTLSSIHGVAAATINGWSQLVTSQLPPGSDNFLLTIPYLVTMLGAYVGFSISSRTRFRLLGLLAPLLVLVSGILLGTSSGISILDRGVPFFVVAIVWVYYLRRQQGPELIGEHTNLSFSGASIMIVLSILFGIVFTPYFLGNSERVVLRNYVIPPFNPEAYPSPLNGFRNYVVTEKNTLLFSVSGVEKNDEIRLATMDSYNGIVWGVGSGSSGSGYYVKPGSPISQPICPSTYGCSHQEVTVVDNAYSDVWLPSVGNVVNMNFGGLRAASLTQNVRFNFATQSLAEPILLSPGDSYSIDSLVPNYPGQSVLSGLDLAKTSLPSPTNVPPVIQSKAGTLTAGISSDFAKLEDLSTKLKQNGVYSDGLSNQAVSVAGAGAYRMAQFFNGVPVGDAEQYSSAMALMADSLGLPSRVVLGTVAKSNGTIQVKGSDITAWVEVDFQGIGWYSFFPTPPTSSKKSPSPPAPPVPSTNIPVVASNLDNSQNSSAASQNATSKAAATRKHVAGSNDIWAVVLDIFELSIPFLVLIIAVTSILALKATRKRKRKFQGSPLDKIVGAWQELKDSALDFGLRLSPVGTRKEHAGELGDIFVPIALKVDRAVFSTEVIEESYAEALWKEIESSINSMSSRYSKIKVLIARVNLASLLAGSPKGFRKKGL